MIKLVSVIAFVLYITDLCIAQEGNFTVSQLVGNHSLESPWEVTFGPDGKLWVTERVGKKVMRIDPETGEQDELITIPAVYQGAGQDGLLGMALHPQLGTGSGSDYVFLSYTYLSAGRKQKLVRYTYSVNGNDGSLSNPVDLITEMPASNDHNSGRLVFGPDGKLYYTIGDQGKNQYNNKCAPIMSQRTPTAGEVVAKDWTSYQGKVLRLNVDGSVPTDNPIINGVRSHIFSYGHRNAQGLVFGTNGKLYSSEHGPKSDDEINIIQSGKNYGWPHVVGYRDNMAYDYCNWSTAPDCNSGGYNEYGCPAGATSSEENSWTHPDFMPPLTTLFTVEDDHDFLDNSCGNSLLCWPTIAPSSLDIYESDKIPGWQKSLLAVSLKRGKVYRLKLSENGDNVVESPEEIWYSQNRYRDIAIDPNGTTFYVITDNGGQTSGPSGNNTTTMANPGTILKIEYKPQTSPEPGEPLSVKDDEEKKQMHLFPNPANTSMTVVFSKATVQDAKRVAVTDLRGRVFMEATGISDLVTLNTTSLSNGLYLVKVLINDDLQWVEKFIVRH